MFIFSTQVRKCSLQVTKTILFNDLIGLIPLFIPNYLHKKQIDLLHEFKTIYSISQILMVNYNIIRNSWRALFWTWNKCSELIVTTMRKRNFKLLQQFDTLRW